MSKTLTTDFQETVLILKRRKCKSSSINNNKAPDSLGTTDILLLKDGPAYHLQAFDSGLLEKL